jgi:predicted HTH transcriptional regulator
MRLDSWGEVERLVRNHVPEGPSLEYKRELSLNSKGEKEEVIKDLTAMGNGGGGALVYGIAEDPKHDGVPEVISPLTDRGLIGVLEDIARSAVRPPLLMNLATYDGAGGFVLAVEVLRSPLGPYMIEAYGERRFYIRIGSRSAPMTKQQVRDAYFLAARARDRRDELWGAHSLPIRPTTGEPRLTLSGLP